MLALTAYSHASTLFTAWGCHASSITQARQHAAMLELSHRLIPTCVVCAGLVEGTHHADILLLLKDGEASEQGLSGLLPCPMSCLSA